MSRVTVRNAIVQEFQLPSGVEPGALLVEECDFDSLKVIELIAFIEDLVGLPEGEAPEEYPRLVTLGDALDYFEELSPELDEHNGNS